MKCRTVVRRNKDALTIGIKSKSRFPAFSAETFAVNFAQSGRSMNRWNSIEVLKRLREAKSWENSCCAVDNWWPCFSYDIRQPEHHSQTHNFHNFIVDPVSQWKMWIKHPGNASISGRFEIQIVSRIILTTFLPDADKCCILFERRFLQFN